MRQALLRQIKLILVILMGYLAHVSLMPYLKFGDVSPSLLIATTAIVTVGYGMLRGLGFSIGFTVLGALLVVILRHFFEENIPQISGFIAEVVHAIQERM